MKEEQNRNKEPTREEALSVIPAKLRHYLDKVRQEGTIDLPLLRKLLKNPNLSEKLSKIQEFTEDCVTDEDLTPLKQNEDYTNENLTEEHVSVLSKETGRLPSYEQLNSFVDFKRKFNDTTDITAQLPLFRYQEENTSLKEDDENNCRNDSSRFGPK